MRDAVVGYSGFVGGSLIRQHAFARKFNSRNIQEAAGEAFNLVICAAAPGSMFEANRFPDRDWARIDALIEHLSTIRTQQFVLISSIAVLADCAGRDDEGTSSFETELAYGRNRRALEVFCANHFERCSILRLPALFGHALKKNFIFDIMNPMPSMLTDARLAEFADRLPKSLAAGLSGLYAFEDELSLFVINRPALAATGRRDSYDAAVTELGLSAVRFTNPDSQFQYYDITRLWADIELCLDHRENLLHLATEPLRAGDIFTALSGQTMAQNSARIHRENMWTRHASLFGREAPYIAEATEIMERLKRFFAAQKAAA